MPKQFLSILTFLSLIFALYSCGSSSSMGMNNMVARMEVKEPIEGVCDNNNVFAILPIEGNGQVESQPPISEEELEKQLNQIEFLKTVDRDFEYESTINVLVNCKGEVVQCYLNKGSEQAELQAQIQAVMKPYNQWQAGTIRGKQVDTMRLMGFAIQDGKLTLD